METSAISPNELRKFIEMLKNVSCGVIDVSHQDTYRTSSFKPIVMRAVHLNHLASMRLSLPPLAMRFSAAPRIFDFVIQKPFPERLPAYLNSIAFYQLLGRQGRTKSDVFRFTQCQNFLLFLFRYLTTERASSIFVAHSGRARDPDAARQSNLPLAYAENFSRIDLCQFPRNNLFSDAQSF